MIRIIPFYTKLAQILVSIIAIGYLAHIGQTILAPLIFAFIFSMLLLPLSNFLEKRFHFPRSVSSLVSILTLILGFVGLFSLLGSQMISIAQDWPAFKKQVLDAIDNLQGWIARNFHVDNNEQMSYLNDSATKALDKGTTLVGQTIISVSSIFIFLLFTLLYTFFILLHRRLLIKFLVALFKEKHHSIVFDIIYQVQYIVKKYIVGLFLQMAIVTILTCTTFLIIGIKYAFLLGLITGIFNIIPYIGILVALLLALLITFATSTASNVLVVFIALCVIHMIDSNYIMPKIVGSKVKINTLIALVGLVVGEMFWGIQGMFLSIPVIAIIKVIFDRVNGLKPWGMLLGEDDSEYDKIVEDADKELLSKSENKEP